ncbi:hypothetical protein TcCL_NonESM07389 [Trypanosoma cruzi]|nr:hypothetical protein TcCL_NonESM07389 [Trypanosoma cruzi]
MGRNKGDAYFRMHFHRHFRIIQSNHAKMSRVLGSKNINAGGAAQFEIRSVAPRERRPLGGKKIAPASRGDGTRRHGEVANQETFFFFVRRDACGVLFPTSLFNLICGMAGLRVDSRFM